MVKPLEYSPKKPELQNLRTEELLPRIDKGYFYEVTPLKEKPEEQIALEAEGCVFEEPQFREEEVPKIITDDEDTNEVIRDIRKELLTKVVIRDNFGEDHKSRRKWRDTLPPDSLEYYDDHSKLRGNNFNQITTALEVLSLDLEDQSTIQEAQKWRSLYFRKTEEIQNSEGETRYVEPYRLYPVDKKIAVAEELHDIAFRALKQLERERHQTTSNIPIETSASIKDKVSQAMED